MANPLALNILVLANFLSFAISNGIPVVVSPGLNVSTNPDIPAHLIPCTNLTYTNAPTIPCYTKLQETGYLENFNLTLAEVCAPTELWSTCLLRAVYEVPGVNCTVATNTTSKCTPFDCATLNSTACPPPVSSNSTNITVYEAEGWYGAWNVYSVHRFIAAWADAINNQSSELAILAEVVPKVANTAVTILSSLIPKYGLNPNADAALVKLIQVPSPTPQPAVPVSHIKGKLNVPSGAEWRQTLYAKLQIVANSAMGNFTNFLDLVEGGEFSTRGLATAAALAGRMKNVTTRG